MPAVSPKKLKRLMITELLVSFAMKRRLSAAQLADLVERGMTDTRFDLSATSDDFADYHMDEAEAAELGGGVRAIRQGTTSVHARPAASTKARGKVWRVHGRAV